MKSSTSEEQKPKAIGDIPPEIKLKIFSYFTTKVISKCLAPVCNEWAILCKDPSLWKRLELCISSEKPADLYREVIARCETSLTYLKLYTPSLENDLYTYFENFNFGNLKELDLRGWEYLYDCDMCNIVSKSPNVEILRLSVDSGISGLKRISELKNLKSLTISRHVLYKVHSSDVELILEKCTKLEALMLQILDGFDDKFLLQLAEYRKETLKHLAIFRGDLTPTGMRALTSCQNLSTLCLKSNGGVLRTEVLVILSTIQNLNWLDLGGTVGSDPETWNTFFMSQNLASLKILEISFTNIDDRAVASLAFTCKQLVIIDLSRNYNLQDTGVRAVIDNCTQLVFLDISSTQITRDILPYIPTNRPQLTYLNVQLCEGINERDLETFTLTYPHVEIMDESDENGVEYTVDERLNLKWLSG